MSQGSVPRRPHLRNDLTWSAVLLVLIAGHFWFPKLGTGKRHDTYSAREEGKKAFYQLVQLDPEQKGHTAARNAEPFGKILDEKKVLHYDFRGEERRVLCLLGPARYPNFAEWDKILDWVKRGGRLIIAARDAKPEFVIEQLKIKVRRVRGIIDADSDRIETDLIPRGRIVWQSQAEIIASPRAVRLLSAEGTTQAVSQSHGNGRVVVVASDFIFSNQSMAFADNSNAVLALRLLEAADEHPGANEFVFDESLNISGTPKVVGLLLNPLFKPLAVQLLIGLVLFAWWRSRPFGPLLPEQTGGRQNIVDHTDSVGILLFRTGDGTTALRAYLRQLFMELKLKAFRGQEEKVLDPLAHRLGKKPETVKRVVQRAVKASKSGHLDRKEAAHLLRQLAVIRRAAHREHRPKRRKSQQESAA